MSPAALQRARGIALAVTSELGGLGLFGVELFVAGDRVWFSEVSPRPPGTDIRLFGKPESFVKRRLGVGLAAAGNVAAARAAIKCDVFAAITLLLAGFVFSHGLFDNFRNF